MQAGDPLHNVRLTYLPTTVPSVPPLDNSAKPLSSDEVFRRLEGKFEGAKFSLEKPAKGDPFAVVVPEQLKNVIRFLRDDSSLGFTNLNVIAAVDYLPKAAVLAAPPNPASASPAPPPSPAEPGRIEVVYVLFSYALKTQFTVKVKLPRDQPKVKSIADLYRAANWYERECYEIVGVVFEGHPHHERILLPGDWVGHPLRRDYIFPEEYNGMKVPL
jgi:NADH-quinone oxidoreductase subunit C